MKSFQQALQQRVTDIKSIKFDKHTIKKATHDVVLSLFGDMGKRSIVVADWNEGTLILQCEKSIWRTETILHKNNRDLISIFVLLCLYVHYSFTTLPKLMQCSSLKHINIFKGLGC